MGKSPSASTSCCCTRCSQPGKRHEQFVSLLFDSRLTPADMMAKGGMPPASYAWDYSRQPLVNLCCHRRMRRYRIGPKATKHNAPYWKHAVVIGPFHGGACLFVRLMKARCRRWRQKQAGRPVKVYHADIEGHKEMMESVLQDLDRDEDDPERRALEQAARALIAETQKG
jgi:hypothetical protein